MIKQRLKSLIKEVMVEMNDEDDLEIRQWNSKINRFNKMNPQRYPCPTCKRPNALSAWEKKQGYQCNQCADREEGLP